MKRNLSGEAKKIKEQTEEKRVALDTLIKSVKADALKDAGRFLKETIVPEGGE